MYRASDLPVLIDFLVECAIDHAEHGLSAADVETADENHRRRQAVHGDACGRVSGAIGAVDVLLCTVDWIDPYANGG